jgi:hypothetical protein
MIRQLTPLNRWLRLSLFFQFGHCPARCDDGSRMHGPTSRVYRSSRRSLTLQCSQCGLLWTMTVHQLAKAAKRLAARDPRAPNRDCAAAWADWAAGVADTRGRKKKKKKGA